MWNRIKSKFYKKVFISNKINFTVSDTLRTLVLDPDSFDSYEHSVFTEKEFEFLFRIAEPLDNYINLHQDFLYDYFFSEKSADEIGEFVVRSTFEFTVLLWVLLTDKFSKKDINVKYGNVIFDSLKYVFLYPDMFNESEFKNFDEAFSSRGDLNNNLLISLYSSEGNYKKRMENFLYLIADKPLIFQKDELRDSENYKISSNYRFNPLLTLSFETYLTNVLIGFQKEMKNILS